MSFRQFLAFLLSAGAIAFASASHALLPQSQASAEDFPSSVAVVFQRNLSKCTATKVAPKTFLTAAHCFDGIQRNPDVTIEQISHGKMILNVRTHITHIRTHFGYVRNEAAVHKLTKTALAILPDIALFKTAVDIDVPIAKLNFDSLHLAQDILIGGYGAQGKGICYPILHPCSLNMAEQKVLHIKSFFFYTAPGVIYPHFLTQGDSGGAAYIRNLQTGELEIVGVNSMMTPASAKQAIDMIFTRNQRANPPRTASIYVRISQQSAWLLNVMRELAKKP